MNMFTKEKKLTLRERATRQMRQVILSGELKPGSRLIEQELSEMMGISRLPIREAITNLENEGLVTIEPYKGAFVNCFSREEVEEIYSVRELLELHALHLVMRRDINDLAEALKKIITRMYDAKTNSDHDFSHLDFDFHEVICKMSGNKILYKLWSTLAIRVLAYMNAEVQQTIQHHDALDSMITSHEKLYKVIASGDEVIAGKNLCEHLRVGRARLIAYTEMHISEQHT